MHSDNSQNSPAPVLWSDAARRLITPNNAKIPSGIWLLLAIGLGARLVAAYYGHWYWRADELFQYLEQAHRAIFGYGYIPWEYRYDARSWLVAGLVFPPLLLAKWLGIDQPEIYATMVNSWNALLSMSIPIGSYLTARRLFSEQTARFALLFTCLWYEFIVLAPRTISESYATFFFMAALAAGAGQNRTRWLLAGFLLGMCISLRLHYLPVAGLLTLLWLWRLPLSLSAVGFAGGFAALLLFGAVDWLTAGQWWGSAVNYYEYVNILFKVGLDSIPDEFLFVHQLLFLRHLFVASAGIYLILIPLMLVYSRRLWPVAFLIIPPFIIYNLLKPRDYSNIFIFLPLFWLLAAELFTILKQKSTRLSRAASGIIACVSLAGLFGWLPSVARLSLPTANYFTSAPLVEATYRANRLIEKKDNTVLVWLVNETILYSGGFYALHLNIPTLFLSGTRTHDKKHQALWDEADVHMRDFATHIITYPAFTDIQESFDEVKLTENYSLYINRKAPTYPVADKWVYDYINPGLEEETRLPARELTPYNPDL